MQQQNLHHSTPSPFMTHCQALYDLLLLDRKYSPWSARDTFASRLEQLQRELEEIHEAYTRADMQNLAEECGDALLDLFFLLLLAQEQGWFSKEQPFTEAIEKLKRRKPWILTQQHITLEQELLHWNTVKAREKQEKRDRQDRVSS